MRRGRPRYLGDSVYGALRQAILDRTFDPGEPLDHLVRVVPKKGAFVRSLSHVEIRDLYQVREELEEGIGRGEARPLTREEREAAARDPGPARPSTPRRPNACPSPRCPPTKN